ncbi:hypothetical protein N9208_05485 [Akkermansiaceae bacterium]|nr:hypothetical protein [Akkermansiaceae bacterium]MDB4374811.1 hypothetical protein [bacterium]MDA7513300.1 hypothetical protein [Akkermansiaceae bacterium]MDA7531639.1 hypothetical protein [Akkermansiaceae bacterium]MDA7539901.1 hypothetical protein [Akkermansiaceae bacterium]
MKRYYRRIAPLLSGNYILPSPAYCEISTPHLLSTMRPVKPGFRDLPAKSKFLPITNLRLTYSFCNSDPAGSHLKKDQGGAGWRQLGRGSLGVDPDRAGGRGAKGLPLAFDLAGGQEFAFVEWSLDQLPDTQNSIPEAR